MGTTLSKSTNIGLIWDHPHIRGDHSTLVLFILKLKGSPPHTWGPQPASSVVPEIVRITPTYVGTTHILTSSAPLNKDHPHIRGDHKRQGNTYMVSLGSPPHTWGPPHNREAFSGTSGITPTYVGTTDTQSDTPRNAKDHPHIRGDHRFCHPM